MNKKKEKFTYESFVRRAKLVHGDKYGYEETKIGKTTDNVKIFCRKHKEYFYQRPYGHLSGKGCPKCANERKSKKSTSTTEQFIKKAKKIHGERYSYDKTNYVNSKTKVVIICQKHGEFLQSPSDHLKGKGCKKCGIEKTHAYSKLSFKDFNERMKILYKDKYICLEKDYQCYSKPVRIYCKKCNTFFIKRVSKFLKGQGCPYCSKRVSKGEETIMSWLKQNRIYFNYQKTFSGCKDKQLLRFDFYIPKYNVCIEYQGRQHFEIVEKFDKDECFIQRQKRDELKRMFCKNNDIHLLEITYKENILNRLKEFFEILQVSCQLNE